MEYLILLVAILFQSTSFVIDKSYQTVKGSSPLSSFRYMSLTGILAVLVFFVINGFKAEFVPYSFALASLINCFSICCGVLSFKILELGTVSLYSIAFLSGGMTLPYIFGTAFLNEEISALKNLGLLLIIGGVVLTNISTSQINKKQIFMCTAVFFLNGLISILSKLHQIDWGFETSTDAEFAMYGSFFKFVVSGILYLFLKKKNETQENKKGYLHIFIAFGAAAVGGISYLLQLHGAAVLPATVVFPLLTGGSVIATAVVGKLIFKEHLSKKSVISIALCFIGAIMFL